MAPPVGLEPTTLRLTAECSTAELRRNIKCKHQPIFPVRRQTSIFGRNELNFRVRNGNGWTLILINTNCIHFSKSVVTRTGIEPMFAA